MHHVHIPDDDHASLPCTDVLPAISLAEKHQRRMVFINSVMHIDGDGNDCLQNVPPIGVRASGVSSEANVGSDDFAPRPVEPPGVAKDRITHHSDNRIGRGNMLE